MATARLWRTAAKSQPLHFVIGDKAHPSETTDMFLDLSQRGPVNVTNSRPASKRSCPIGIEGGIGTSIFSRGRNAAYWLGLLHGRGQRFRASGFHGGGLPAAFSRRACLAFADPLPAEGPNIRKPPSDS